MNHFTIFGLKSLCNLSGLAILLLTIFCFPAQTQSQCRSTPFPDQWTVHELETSELPYRSVYIYADFDIDGDGRKDIVTGQWWYRNPGSASGNWVRSTIGGAFRNMAHIHDFDNDGDLDLLGTTGAYTGADLVWAENDGSGRFTIHDNIPSGATDYREPFVAGVSGANFQNGGPYQIAINWNGAEDTDSPVQMLTVPADPVNTDWPIANISSSSLGEDLQKGDIDDDGDLDLFQSKNWLRNDGNTWTTINTGIDYVTTPDRAQLADFDGDGDLDAVVGQLTVDTSNSRRMEFAWFETPSNPEQNWTRRTLATDINGSLSVFAEDIDQDGDDDIIVGEWKGNNRLIAFENDLCNSGEWIRHTINAGGTGFDHHDGARVVDIDNDGDLDIVSIGWDNIVPRIFENRSSTASTTPPLANAGTDQNITLPVDAITLTGSGSDPDGGNVTFQWTQQNGPNTATLSENTTTELSASGLIEGSYAFRLTVTDDEEDTAFNEVTVTVNPAEVVTEQPLVNAGADQRITLPVDSVSMTGSGSDPDGGDVTFLWTQQSGPSTATLSGGTSTALSASGLIEGSYVFRLTVTDNENETAFDEVTVMVNMAEVVTENPDGPTNQPPVVSATVTPLNGEAPLEVTFDASESTDDAAITSYNWDFGNGDTSSEINPVYIFETPGTYTVTLTVADTEGLTSDTEINIIVTESESEPEPQPESNPEPEPEPRPELEPNNENAEIRLENNPAKNGMARLRLINQPDGTEVISLYLHDSTGRLIKTYDVQQISAGNGTYDIPVATLLDGVYHIGVKTNVGGEKTISLLVRN